MFVKTKLQSSVGLHGRYISQDASRDRHHLFLEIRAKLNSQVKKNPRDNEHDLYVAAAGAYTADSSLALCLRMTTRAVTSSLAVKTLPSCLRSVISLLALSVVYLA